MTDNVKSLFGGPTGERKPNQAAIIVLEQMLEMARTGEVVGVVIGAQYFDDGAMRSMGGLCGTLAMIGILEEVKVELIRDRIGD